MLKFNQSQLCLFRIELINNQSFGFILSIKYICFRIKYLVNNTSDLGYVPEEAKL